MLLLAEGYPQLTAQVLELRLYDRCRCGDDFCESFDTSPRPMADTWPGGLHVAAFGRTDHRRDQRQDRRGRGAFKR